MKITNKQTNNSSIIFIVIAILYAIGNFIWWYINTPVMPLGVNALHLNTVFFKKNLFMTAPLMPYIMRGMFYVFGKEYYDLIVIFVNYIFFLIPLYFVYKIGVELKDKETGNIAMILFALVPAIYAMSRKYGHQDYHIVAAITFNIYCLIKTNYFQNRKWSIIYGISVGLGLLIKYPFLVYFFMPFAYIVLQSFKHDKKLSVTINVLLSVLVFILMSCCHYFRGIIMQKIWLDHQVETVSILKFANIRPITTGLWAELLSPPIFLVFIIGLIYFIWKYKGKYRNIILLWFFVPWCGILLMGHYKIAQYGLGFIPATVLMGALGLSNINRTYLKKFIIIFVVIVGLFQYADFSFGVDTKIFNWQTVINGHNIKYYKKNNRMIKLRYREIDTLEELMIFLNKNYSDKIICVSDLLEYPDYDAIMLQMNLKGIRYIYVEYYGLLLASKFPAEQFIENLKKTDIVLFPDLENHEILNINYERMKKFPIFYKNITKEEQIDKLNHVINTLNKDFYKIDTFYLEDDNEETCKIILLAKK